MRQILRLATLFCGICCCAAAQEAVLSVIRTIHVSQLGDNDDAAMVREQIIARLSSTGRFKVVDDLTAADVNLVGRVQVNRSQSAVVLPQGGVAGEVKDVLLVVRLLDRAKATIWSYDSSTDKRAKGMTKSLLEAIAAEEKVIKQYPKVRK